MVLDWCNRHARRNQIIAVRSPKLCQIKGRSVACEGGATQWLGYDFVALGHWSLLVAGLFVRPSAFPQWESRLNQHGLFPDGLLLERYYGDYQQAASRGEVEDLPPEVYGTDAIEIGRVQ